MDLLDRSSQEQLQLDVGIEPASLRDAIGRIAADLAVSPRAVATSIPIVRPEALLWAHSWVTRCRSVVDVGSGLGCPAVFLHQQRAGKTTLVESDPFAAAHARRFTGLEVINTPIDSLPMEPDECDGATSIAPLGHGPERAGMIPELGRVVRSGGHVSVWTCVSNTSSSFDSASVRFPTLSQLEAEFYAAGLEVDSWITSDRFPVEPSWQDIQETTMKRARDDYGTSTTVVRELAEAKSVSEALKSGELTSLVYRLVVR